MFVIFVGNPPNIYIREKQKCIIYMSEKIGWTKNMWDKKTKRKKNEKKKKRKKTHTYTHTKKSPQNKQLSV